MAKEIVVRIRRADSAALPPRWEEFAIPYASNMNIISCLMEIRKRPMTRHGKMTTPVVWECSCLEEVCGACSMVINGRVRQACSALVDKLEQPITLEPMSKFPLIRDLIVDRSRMFEALKRVKAWVPIDGTHNLGPGPRMDAATVLEAYHLSRCMSCGCCLEACPQVNDSTSFIGAAAINQARLFNTHPTGATLKAERLESLMEKGGISDCGNAQNCERACPKDIPLVKSIAEVNREITKHLLFGWLAK